VTATLVSVSSLMQDGAAVSCNAPTGTTGGMMLVAFQAGGTLAGMATPTGGETWTLLGQQGWSDAATSGTNVWWKIAGGSEPASYGFTSNSSSNTNAIGIALISDTAQTAPVFASSASGTATASIPTPSITPTAADDLDLRWITSRNSAGQVITFTPPSEYTEQLDFQSGVQLAASLATKQLSSGSATGIQTFTGSRTSIIHMGLAVAVTKSLFLAPRPTVIGQAIQRAAFY
jgi:hypothetical protein